MGHFQNVNRGYYNNYRSWGFANNRFQQRPGYQRYNSFRNRSYNNQYRGPFKPQNRYVNSCYGESTAPAMPAASSQSGRQEGVTMATTPDCQGSDVLLQMRESPSQVR